MPGASQLNYMCSLEVRGATAAEVMHVCDDNLKQEHGRVEQALDMSFWGLFMVRSSSQYPATEQ